MKYFCVKNQALFDFHFVGVYKIECLGLYCGDCSLTIFLSFAGYIKCVRTTSISILQKGVVHLYLENLSVLAGYIPVYVS